MSCSNILQWDSLTGGCLENQERRKGKKINSWNCSLQLAKSKKKKKKKKEKATILYDTQLPDGQQKYISFEFPGKKKWLKKLLKRGKTSSLVSTNFFSYRFRNTNRNQKLFVPSAWYSGPSYSLADWQWLLHGDYSFSYLAVFSFFTLSFFSTVFLALFEHKLRSFISLKRLFKRR